MDSSSWSSSPLVLLRDIYNDLISNCDCKDTVSPQWNPVARVRVGHSQQDGDEHQKETDPLLLPELTRLHEAVCETNFQGE